MRLLNNYKHIIQYDKNAGIFSVLTDRSFGYAASHGWHQFAGSFHQPPPSLSTCDSSLQAPVTSSVDSPSALIIQFLTASLKPTHFTDPSHHKTPFLPHECFHGQRFRPDLLR